MDQEVTIDFSDTTMAETDGIFKDVQKKMCSEFPYRDDWMVRSSATIVSKFGCAEMLLHFYGNKKLYIVEYSPSSSGDVYYNPDISAVSTWAQANGWNIPEPSKELILSAKAFWKYFYDTLLVDSEYFDSLYGKRDNI